MMDFIKTCGTGLLYLLLSPFILAIFAIFILITLISFVITFFKATLIFFKGKSIFDPIPEEIEAQKILESRKSSASTQQFQQNPYMTQQLPYQNLMQPQTQQLQINHPPINQIPENNGGDRHD